MFLFERLKNSFWLGVSQPVVLAAFISRGENRHSKGAGYLTNVWCQRNNIFHLVSETAFAGAYL
jgi:hypothetical protein